MNLSFSFFLISGITMTINNPWLVENIETFNFLCCPECVYRSKEKTSFQNHALQNHERSKPFFLTIENCMKIEINEENDSVSIDIKEEHEYKENDNNSLMQIQNTENLTTCNYCEEQFDSELQMQYHIDQEHSVYFCPQCSFKTHSLELLDNHLEFHKRYDNSEDVNVDFEDFENFFKETPKQTNSKKLNVDSKLISDHELKDLTIPIQKLATYKCKDCQEIFPSKIARIRHKKTSHATENLKVFDCHFCDKKFENISCLSAHIKRRHSHPTENLQVFDCHFCDKKFENISSLSAHIKRRHKKQNLGDTTKVKKEEKLYKCEQCSEEFKTNLSLKKHASEIHGILYETKVKKEQKNYKCQECFEEFKTNQSWKKHASEIHGITYETKVMKEQKNHKCEECFEAFNTNLALKKHALQIHGINLSCDCCNEQFSDYLEYDKHYKENHNLFCDKCETKKMKSKKYETRFDLENHIKFVHNKESVKCQEKGCIRVCKSSQGLITHYRTQHDKFPPGYSNQSLCYHCAKVFTNKSNLENHILRDHTAETDKAPSFTKKYRQSNDRKNYIKRTKTREKLICQHCEKTFMHPKNLREHILVTHENYTPYHCDQCPRKFGIRSKLKSHKDVVHAKVICDICDQQTYNFFELKRHKASAHGIVPENVFLCDICPLFFKHQVNLDKHKQSKHPG